MICRYFYLKNSKSEPPGIEPIIDGSSVAFDKHKNYLKLGIALIILPIKSVISPGNAQTTASYYTFRKSNVSSCNPSLTPTTARIGFLTFK